MKVGRCPSKKWLFHGNDLPIFVVGFAHVYDLPIFLVRLAHFVSGFFFGTTFRVTVMIRPVLTENEGATISNYFWYANLIGFFDFIRAVANVSCAEG